MKTFVISLAFVVIGGSAAWADDVCNAPAACQAVETHGDPGCCGRCGSNCPCQKYCKVVCEMKEVKKHVWVVKCSEFCPSLPNCGGKSCCDSCGAKCDAECGCDNGCNNGCDPCAVEKNKRIVPPKCGKMREKKTLEKKEIVCKVPSYKCVVVYCCPSCGTTAGESGLTAPAGETPPTPAPSPAPEKTTLVAPLPPLAGASY